MRPKAPFKQSAEWDTRFYGVAQQLATWPSKDPDRKTVGAVAVSPDGLLVSWGYSGLPRGLKHGSADTEPCLTVHAELNAVLNSREDMKDWTVYVTKPPCLNCALVLAQKGIARVVCPLKDETSGWFGSQQLADKLFDAVGIVVIEGM